MKSHLTRTVFALSVVLLNTANVWASIARIAPDGSTCFRFDGRIEPRISCRPLMVCDLELEPGETINNLAIGDSTRWIVATAQSGSSTVTWHIFLKPTALDLRTNLIIATNLRTYHLDLRSSKTLQNSRISFYYPQDEAAAAAARKAEQHNIEDRQKDFLPLLPPDELDSKYRVKGSRDIRPRRVYRDGVHTFIEYDHLPPDLPAVYAVNTDNVEQIVNFRVHENLYIVDSIQNQFNLVWNAGAGPHGRGQHIVYIRHK